MNWVNRFYDKYVHKEQWAQRLNKTSRHCSNFGGHMYVEGRV